MDAASQDSLRQKRRLVTQIPGPRSSQLHAQRGVVVARGVASALPVYVAEASGAIVVDVDGNSFIDLGSGIGVATAGHAHPAVAAAVATQAERFTHTCFMIVPYEGYVEVCAELSRVTPGHHAKKSALFNSGAEAVENAVKIARHSTGRGAVVVFDHAYHGRTNLTMALTAKNTPYKDGFGPFAPDIYRVPTSYPFRDPKGMTGDEAAQRAVDQIETQVGAANTACVVIEPIQGEGGIIVPAQGFLVALARWCRDNGVLFVADEIQTGFCRTGSWFACEHEGVVPDLVTTAKAIAGGMPLSAVTGDARVMEEVHVGGLGGTFGGNPVACAAALASIRTMEDLDLASAASKMEATLSERLLMLQAAHPCIGEVRGRGAMYAMELVKAGTKRPNPEAAQALARACHEAGVIVLTCGTWGNVVRLLPPLVIDDALLIEATDVLAEAADTVLAPA
jgi:4-aminobutyrate aminotransferase/(S)-3-amino-2-methylpropionate transaminase